MIYLHVPFCESRCTYCGFYSNVISSGAQGDNKNLCFESYADAVCAEIAARREEIAQTLGVNTLYIGGGTPSVLPLDVLSKIVRSLSAFSRSLSAFSRSQGASARSLIASVRSLSGAEGPVVSPWSEFTIEVNPEDIVQKGEEYVKGLLALGVNRISMGVQSFDDGILRWMNRRHDSAEAVEAFRILRRCGVMNISIDLIFGLPQLSEKVWANTIERALDLKPEHISAYQLSIEEGSAIEKLVAKGGFTEATDERCREQYDLLCARLGEAGYHHYEVSNFSLPGYEAVHNSAYWRRVPYVGLGPGAHSLSAGSVRSWNSESLGEYSREEEVLTPEDIRVERIMLPLRTDAGLPEDELRSLAGDAPVDRLLSEGALWFDSAHQPAPFEQSQVPVPERSRRTVPERSRRIRIPEDHFFTSDDIISDLI